MTGRGRPVESVSIYTFGCRSNRYDSAGIEGLAQGRGLRVVAWPGKADAYVINTCTVTAKADREARQTIRRIRRENPSAMIVVTGCYAQVSPGEATAIDGVDAVIGNPSKGRIIDYLLGADRGLAQVTELGDWRDGVPISLRAAHFAGRARANLKIQDGCDRRCTYCVIPMARGRSKSLPAGEILAEMAALSELGYVEFVLTGIHLGAWGADLSGAPSITGLLREIERSGLPVRVRISSIDPDEVTPEFVELISASSVVCPHVHLPLQSGDDRILSLMGRPYTARAFEETVTRLYEAVAGISIGTDVIAGFPGEGAREFENTRALVSALPISYMHVFPWSPRKGAPAVGLAGRVAPPEIKRRCKSLGEVDILKRKAFFERFVGAPERVLVELAPDRVSGLLKGRTRNYIEAYLEDSIDAPGLAGREVAVTLTGPFRDGMKARCSEPIFAGLGRLP